MAKTKKHAHKSKKVRAQAPQKRVVKTRHRDIFEWFEEQPRKKQITLAVSIGLLLFLCFTVVAQFLYPAGRLLPGVRVQGQLLAAPTVNQVKKQLDTEYKDAKVTFKLSDASETAPLKSIGLDVASEVTARNAASYPLWQRLIPLSSAYIMLTRDTPISLYKDDIRIKEYANMLSGKYVLPAENATVAVTNGQIELVRAKPSRTFPSERIITKLLSTPLSPHMTVTVEADTTQASRNDAAVQEVFASAKKLTDRKLTLYAADEHITVDGKTIASWLEFPEDGKGNVTMQVSVPKLTEYLSGIASRVYKEPGTTVITMVDGIETGQTVGEEGRGLNIELAADQINRALTERSDAPIQLGMQVLPPKVSYNKQYTGSNAGLMNLLESIRARRGYSIAIIELGGGGRVASVGGEQTWHTASIYKAMVAYVVLKEIEAGNLSWSQPVMAGRDLSDCFELMIVQSDNTCGTYVGELVGRQHTQDELHAIGMTSTFFDGERRTTANDLALFMKKLQTGEILQGAARDKLVNAMTRQIYRSGIPYGTGWPTANKVGYVGIQRHDAGIVYGPEGPYIMVIMTNGAGWPSIAATAREIHNFLYP